MAIQIRNGVAKVGSVDLGIPLPLFNNYAVKAASIQNLTTPYCYGMIALASERFLNVKPDAAIPPDLLAECVPLVTGPMGQVLQGLQWSGDIGPGAHPGTIIGIVFACNIGDLLRFGVSYEQR